MPTIHLEAEVSRESLLNAVDQLNSTELDQFVTDVLDLRARRAPIGFRHPSPSYWRGLTTDCRTGYALDTQN